MKLMLILGLLFSFNSFCLANMEVDKDQMNQMLSQLKEQGVFSEEDIKKAQQELNKMSDEDFKNLQDKAAEQMKNNPEILEKVNKLNQH